MTVVVVVFLVAVSWSCSALLLVVSAVVRVLAERQDVGVAGVVAIGPGTGGSGGLELLFICCFSGDGVFALELTTSSFI